MNVYQQQILDHYHSPQNSGKPSAFTHTLKLENLSCGDEITVYLNVADDVITSMRYEAEGCAISIAAASMLSEQVVGKSLAEVKGWNLDSMLALLQIDLTPARIKCATLPLEAVQSATSE